jgi:ubiquinone/menaquinone biosynthesis methyltransferase
MNDLMSGGMHRLWKSFTIARSGVREGSRVLDVAGGTGDLSLAFARKVGKTGQVWLTDINNAMLTHGRDRLCDKGFLLPVAQCDAEKLPFPDDYFDCVTVAFGLRNMTHKDLALAEMRRVLRPAAACSSSSSRRSGSRWHRSTISIRSRSSRASARSSPRTPTATAISPSRSGSTPIRKR